MNSPRIVKVGAHQVELSEGLALLRWIGFPTFDDVRGVFEVVSAERVSQRSYFIVADMRKSEIPDASTRRWATEWVRQNQPTGFASFGNTAAIRAILALMMNAIRLLDRRQPPTRFFETEHEARSWVEQERIRAASL